MSLWSRVRAALGAAQDTELEPGERTGAVRSGAEDTGGVPSPTADRHSTTGTSPSGSVVGRVGGDDGGYLETGAERRAEAQEGNERADE